MKLAIKTLWQLLIKKNHIESKESIRMIKSQKGDTEEFKDLAKRTASEKNLGDKAFNIAKNQKYNGYERGITSMVYEFFDKKSSGSDIKSVSNQKLIDDLYKPIIKKFKK